MGYCFDERHSMYRQAGMNVEQTLAAIARRYVGFNPPHAPTCRACSKRGILRGEDYRYHADFNRFFPCATTEQLVYACVKYWADGASELKFDVSCFGPIVVYCNGQVVFRSNIFPERYSDDRHSVIIPLVAGWNHFVIRLKKTRAGLLIDICFFDAAGGCAHRRGQSR